MPSLFRFLVIVGIIGTVIYAGIVMMAVMIEPHSREITVTVPPDRLLKR